MTSQVAHKNDQKWASGPTFQGPFRTPFNYKAMPRLSPATDPTSASRPLADGLAAKHYENFPVASWLCPPHLRAPIAAIYQFARTADDIADEGQALPQERLNDLAAMRADLLRVSGGQPHSGRWPEVFDRLAPVLVQFTLPVNLLTDLLCAFEQDVVKTRDHADYASHAELLDYCRRSANPIGRLLLHLYRIDDETSLSLSDNICTALQLINFWQDLGGDLARGRNYLPEDECVRFAVTAAQLRSAPPSTTARSMVAAQVGRAKTMMHLGAPLAKRIPDRAGWELRLVVQGGLRIIEKIERLNFDTLSSRPKITASDVPLMFWRALWM
jgi:hydroxysqualene synthase